MGSREKAQIIWKVKEKEGDGFMSEGDKYSSRSMFRWKPDWLQSAQAYKKAAISYQASKNLEKLVSALEKRANAEYNGNSIYSAAQCNLEAGNALQRMKGEDSPGRACEKYVVASQFFQESDDLDKAADAAIRAGRIYDEKLHDEEMALDQYNNAIEMYEIDDKEILSNQAFAMAVALAVRGERFAEAIDLLKKECDVYSKHDKYEKMFRNYLQIMVLVLHSQDFIKADAMFQDFLQTEGFYRSEEGKVLNELLDACEKKDLEQFQVAIKSRVFKYIDQSIGRMARGLTILEAPVRKIDILPGEEPSSMMDLEEQQLNDDIHVVGEHRVQDNFGSLYEEEGEQPAYLNSDESEPGIR